LLLLERLPMFSVKHNVREVLSFTDRLSSQYEFAVASALTETVKAVQAAMPVELDKALDRPTQFTKRGFFIVPARKDRLVAVVGVKDQQLRYMQFQIYGGDRYPTRKALKLPGEVKLDASGNIPRAELRRLIAEAKRVRKNSRKARAGYTSYTGKSQGVFYGKPANRPELPAGIYRRVESENGQQGRFLQPLVLFPSQPASYEQRFDFFGIAQRLTLQAFRPTLVKAWARAKATAR
jgi:hypothetical protein